MKNQLITDSQSLISAKGRFGHEIPVYDDGFGPLFIHRDSMGISGIVRAQTWEDAYSICEDEFFPAATETEEEWVADYGENFHEDGAWNESYGFRNSGGIYAKDLNGDALDLLTPELLERMEITLQIESNEPPAPAPRFFLWHSSRFTNRNGRQVFSISGRYGSDYAKVSPSFVARKAGLVSHSHASPTWEDTAE
jgi:hypothetical protein